MVSTHTTQSMQKYQTSNHPFHDVFSCFHVYVFFFFDCLKFTILLLFLLLGCGIREVSMKTMVLWAERKKKTCGPRGYGHFSRRVFSFNAKFTQIPTRMNAICIAWTVWMEPFVLHVLLPTKNTEQSRYSVQLKRNCVVVFRGSIWSNYVGVYGPNSRISVCLIWFCSFFLHFWDLNPIPSDRSEIFLVYRLHVPFNAEFANFPSH